MTVSNIVPELPIEMLYNIFAFCRPEDNIKTNTLVCRTWQDTATDVAKLQLIHPVEQLRQDIQNKAANFLKMLPENLQDLALFCPAYAQFEQVKNNRETYTTKEVYDITRNDSPLALEKYTVCMAFFYRINPECPNITSARKDALAGKVFAELHYTKKNENGNFSCFWSQSLDGIFEGCVRFFPIELFNLKMKVKEEDYKVKGDKDNGTVCFPLGGRLIELMLEKGEEELRNAKWTGIRGVNRDTAVTINLTPEEARSGYVWPYDLYVASLDAPPATKAEAPNNTINQ